MLGETSFRVAFAVLLGVLFTMRGHFLWKVRRTGRRWIPDREAVQREGRKGVLVLRIMLFCLLIAILGMHLLGTTWIGSFTFPLPVWIRWTGCG